MSSDVQTLRLRRPDQQAPKKAPVTNIGILKDQLRLTHRRPWVPSFSLAVRLLLLVRTASAMYSNIDDCDEVYNFWEPLHFLDRGYGFQTWEVSPQYSIRSWAYIAMHILPTRLARLFLGVDKRPAFFAVRFFLCVICTLAEAKLYRTVCEKINDRVGRYLFFMLLFSAGMWNASTAFLPSSFAMYMTMFAFSYAIVPPMLSNNRRTLMATLCFATGAIVGWPFALAIAVPFIFEELFIYGGDTVPVEARNTWRLRRWKRLFASGLAAALIFIPVIAIDSMVYGKMTIVPWNIVRYNVFGGLDKGPDLYGTSPWNFYFLNLVLNFNILQPLALISLPGLAMTYTIDRHRLGFLKPSTEQSSPFTILAIRLVPFYLWLGIMSLQPHKEERFMFPAYPLLCFNAAVALYLVRGWQEALFIKFTKSPYRASRTSLFRNFTFSVLISSSVLSVSRIVALWHYYHAPMTVHFLFETQELPRLLNVTGFLPEPPQGMSEDELPSIDLSPIEDFDLRLCFGKEWHRFPSHYLVPTGVSVDFIRSEFHGLLPAHFGNKTVTSAEGSYWWSRPEAKFIPSAMNDVNREEPSRYVSIEDCDYLIDLDFPRHPVSSVQEPRYAIDSDTWDRVHCMPFLDARHSNLLTRILWMPGKGWQEQNTFGDYCLLKNKALVLEKELKMASRKT